MLGLIIVTMCAERRRQGRKLLKFRTIIARWQSSTAKLENAGPTSAAQKVRCADLVDLNVAQLFGTGGAEFRVYGNYNSVTRS